jgi:uncharacterized protein (DUF924 family)
MDPAKLDEVHEFWFGKLDGPEASPSAKQEIWFRQSDETDRIIRDRFGQSITSAAYSDWDVSALSREQQVALVVLFDQFPRNIHRHSGAAFAHDERAREIASELIAEGVERFYLAERNFVFLPFMHSENIADQDYATMLCAAEAVSAPPSFIVFARLALDFATKHRDIIRKFGRFPHRNAMLGRKSTPEEEAFLKEHGRGF